METEIGRCIVDTVPKLERNDTAYVTLENLQQKTAKA